MYDRSDLVTSPAALGYKLVHTAGRDEERYICTSDPFIPSSSPKPTGGWNRWLGDPTVPCIRLNSTISREGLEFGGIGILIGAVGDIVLGAFQSCDAEVVGRAERIGRAVEFD